MVAVMGTYTTPLIVIVRHNPRSDRERAGVNINGGAQVHITIDPVQEEDSAGHPGAVHERASVAIAGAVSYDSFGAAVLKLPPANQLARGGIGDWIKAGGIGEEGAVLLIATAARRGDGRATRVG